MLNERYQTFIKDFETLKEMGYIDGTKDILNTENKMLDIITGILETFQNLNDNTNIKKTLVLESELIEYISKLKKEYFELGYQTKENEG